MLWRNELLKSECQIGNRFVISKLLKIGNSKQKPCNTEEMTSGLTISAPYTPTTPRELSDIRRACIWDFAGSPSSLPQLPGPKAQLVGSFRKLLLELWFVFVVQIIVAIFFYFYILWIIKNIHPTKRKLQIYTIAAEWNGYSGQPYRWFIWWNFPGLYNLLSKNHN